MHQRIDPAVLLEEAIVGMFFLSEDLCASYAGTLHPDMFFNAENAGALVAASSLCRNGCYSKEGLWVALEKEAGVKAPKQFYDRVVSAVAQDTKFEVLYPQWLDLAKRRYIKAKTAEAEESSKDFAEYHEATSQAARTALTLGGWHNDVDMPQVVNQWRENTRTMAASKGQKLNTYGLPVLDDQIINLPGQTTVVAARPGCGKTSFAIQCARRWQENGQVIFNSLEVSPAQFITKYLENAGAGSGYLLRRPWNMGDGDWQRAEAGLKTLLESNLIVTQQNTLAGIRSLLMKLRPKVFILDYLQRMPIPPSWRDGEAKWLNHVCYELTDMGRDFGVEMYLLCQINRDGDDEPRLIHLKGSGAIEETADNIILLHRPFKETGTGGERLKAIANPAKVKYGSDDRKQELLFDPTTQNFHPWDSNRAETLARVLMGEETKRKAPVPGDDD